MDKIPKPATARWPELNDLIWFLTGLAVGIAVSWFYVIKILLSR